MRYYSPWTCRFISVDPLTGKHPSKTPYHYCSNDPINRVDPTGMEDTPSSGGGQSPPKSASDSPQAPPASDNVPIPSAPSSPANPSAPSGGSTASSNSNKKVSAGTLSLGNSSISSENIHLVDPPKSKVQKQLYENVLKEIENGTADRHNETACYPTVWKRLQQAYKDAGIKGPKALQNKGRIKSDSDTSDRKRWYPTGNGDFNVLGSSNYKSEKWLDLPEKYRGEGMAGALADAGYAEDPQDAWDGNLKPGAILQMWNTESDYEGIKSGKGFDESDLTTFGRKIFRQKITDDGHSAVFLGYNKVLGIIVGIRYVDQGGEKFITRLSPSFGVIRGANLKDKSSK